MSDTPPTPSQRITLRDLPLAARIVMSAFLISVGIGYTSAIVQLHFQHAKPGEFLPDREDAARVYFGQPGMGTLERLIRADEHLPFNGSGSMRSAFFRRSGGWPNAIGKKARAMKVDRAQAEKEVRKDRLEEIEAVLQWITAGAKKDTFEDHALPAGFLREPAQENDFFNKAADGSYHANIKEIFGTRCARCHHAGGGGAAGQIDLTDWEHVADWVHQTEGSDGFGMSLTKLAQTTHVHLLGFGMLYGMTGIILAFSSYPGWLRVILCPLPLIAQVLDISCWWLARFDPMFAHFILYTGGVVALGLMLHIVLSLLNMYGVAGKLVLLLLFAGAAGGGFFLKTGIIDPYLNLERTSHAIPAP